MSIITELKESKFDIVFDSQKVFRILMNVYAFPGRIHKLPEINLSGIDRKYNPVIIPLLTLLDLETSFHVIGNNKAETDKIIKYLEINTASQYTNIKDADYFLSILKPLGDSFKLLNKGSLIDPDKSTTLFYFLENISNDNTNNNSTIILNGPGIKNEETLSIHGIPQSEIKEWIGDRANYPLGIDIFLIDQNFNIAGLPRSTKIRFKN